MAGVREGGGAADAWRTSLVVTLRRVLSIEALLPEFNQSGTAAPWKVVTHSIAHVSVAASHQVL